MLAYLSSVFLVLDFGRKSTNVVLMVKYRGLNQHLFNNRNERNYI